MQCPLHNQKVNKPSFHGASCQLAPFNSLNTQSTVLTNRSVMVASVVDGEWRWQPYQNLLNSVFIPYNMSASVIECRSIGSCSSSGLCAGLMITGLQFQLLFTLPPPPPPPPPWHRMPVRGMKTIFKNLCYNKYGLPYCVACPSIRTDPGIPPPGYSATPRTRVRDPGSVLILGQVTQYGNPYLICITH